MALTREQESYYRRIEFSIRLIKDINIYDVNAAIGLSEFSEIFRVERQGHFWVLVNVQGEAEPRKLYCYGSDKDIKKFINDKHKKYKQRKRGGATFVFGRFSIGVFGETALHALASNGNSNGVKWFLDYGADPNAKDAFKNRTALSWAIKGLTDGRLSFLYRQTISALVFSGATLDSSDVRGMSELDYAVNSDEYKFILSLKRVSEHNKDFDYHRDLESDDDELDYHGDDSSDEESVNLSLSRYQVEVAWAGFLASQSFINLLQFLNWEDTEQNREKILLVFVVHAKGAGFLYDKRVNEYYYHHPSGKRSLGESKIPELENSVRRAWVGGALIATLRQVNYDDRFEDGYKTLVFDGYTGEDNLRVNGLEDQLSDSMDIESAVFFREMICSRDRIISFVNNSREALLFVAQQIGKTVSEVKKPKHVESVIKFGVEYFSVNENEVDWCAGLTQRLNGAGGANDLLFFDYLFYHNLNRSRSVYDIKLERGTKKPYVFSPFFYGYQSVGLFSSLRVFNRFQKREIRTIRECLDFFSHDADSAILHDTSAVVSQWQMLQGAGSQIKETISKFFARTSHMPIAYEFPGVDSKQLARKSFGANNGTYKGINERLAYLTNVVGVSEVSIAEDIIDIVNGKAPNNCSLELERKPDELAWSADEVSLLNSFYIPFISDLTTLLFVVEPMRNPAAFVCHHMMLDLVIQGEVSWQELLDSANENSGGMMPMSMVKAVQCSRYAFEAFEGYLPSKYHYEGKADEATPALLVDFINRTSSLVTQWFVSTENVLDEDAALGRAIAGLLNDIAPMLSVLEVANFIDQLKSVWFEAPVPPQTRHSASKKVFS